MKKGIIFDMDGTLWDSAENVAISWNIALDKVGFQREPITKDDMYRVMGLTMDKIADLLFDGAKDEMKDELLRVSCVEENEYLKAHGGVIYPDLRSTMEELKGLGYHLYIVSNCQSGYIESFLDYYQFHDLFEDIECYGNNDKPKADNIALVVERNALDAAVYVGDIQGDYDSSLKAGVSFIHAAYGFGTINACVPAIHSLKELPQLVGTVI